MRLFGLIGYPLTHSFSKKYFTEKFEREGLDNCRYELFPIKSIYEVKELLQRYPDLEGLNVTIPYKKLVLRHLHTAIAIPDGVAACNCIRVKNGKLAGFNTDIIGFEKSLLPLLRPYHKKALVLGNGGATEAVTYVLQKLSISFEIVSRTIHDGSTLTYNEIDEKTISDHLLIINTTPLGTFPNMEEAPAIPYQFITPEHCLYDLVYNPAKTLFLQKGEEKGAAIKNGYEMLLLQAEGSWNIWNDFSA